MLFFTSAGRFCLLGVMFLGLPAAILGQTNYYSANGTEYPLIGSLPGDQVFPDAALTVGGGFVVWQDNATDGSGWGISARRLDNTLSGTMGTFRVNLTGTNDQQNPRVALLKNGGGVFVWQGGLQGYQHIFAQFCTASNIFLNTTDLLVSTFTNNFQINPAVAVLNNSNVVVVWASYNQAGSNSLQDVYAKILSPTGQTVVGEFLVNQFTSFNQRTPTVAALQNGGFVIGWVSEQERSTAPNWGTNASYVSAGSTLIPSVDVYARIYASNGTSAGDEFLVNAGMNPCANPAVCAASDGGFEFVWAVHDMVNTANGWDIYARAFSASGTGGMISLVNTYLYGDQYAPRISSIGTDYIVVWTSLAQDGSREGVFGRFLNGSAAPVGGEFRVNTTTVSQQMQPVVVSDGSSQFVAIWTSFTGSPYNFDLYAQRYLNVGAVLQPMSAPFVAAPFVVSNGIYQPQLQVTWAPLLGISVSNYEVYVDGVTTSPLGVVTGNEWVMTAANGLTTSSTHSFTVDYVTTDGRRSPMSPSASGKTWGGGNYYGIPFEWMQQYYGNNFADWPVNVNAPLAPGGMSLLHVFLSGGNPLDSNTWLRQTLTQTPQGLFLNWNTQPGATYQVQVSTNLSGWVNLGSERFAAGTADSIYVGGSAAGYYRVLLVR